MFGVHNESTQRRIGDFFSFGSNTLKSRLIGPDVQPWLEAALSKSLNALGSKKTLDDAGRALRQLNAAVDGRVLDGADARALVRVRTALEQHIRALSGGKNAADSAAASKPSAAKASATSQKGAVHAPPQQNMRPLLPVDTRVRLPQPSAVSAARPSGLRNRPSDDCVMQLAMLNIQRSAPTTTADATRHGISQLSHHDAGRSYHAQSHHVSSHSQRYHGSSPAHDHHGGPHSYGYDGGSSSYGYDGGGSVPDGGSGASGCDGGSGGDGGGGAC